MMLGDFFVINEDMVHALLSTPVHDDVEVIHTRHKLKNAMGHLLEHLRDRKMLSVRKNDKTSI